VWFAQDGRESKLPFLIVGLVAALSAPSVHRVTSDASGEASRRCSPHSSHAHRPPHSTIDFHAASTLSDHDSTIHQTTHSDYIGLQRMALTML
jgi:hypothetical protein